MVSVVKLKTEVGREESGLSEQLVSRQTRNYAYARFMLYWVSMTMMHWSSWLIFKWDSNYILSDFEKTVWRIYQAILYNTFLRLFATIDTSTSSDFHHLPKSVDWPSAKTKVLL